MFTYNNTCVHIVSDNQEENFCCFSRGNLKRHVLVLINVLIIFHKNLSFYRKISTFIFIAKLLVPRYSDSRQETSETLLVRSGEYGGRNITSHSSSIILSFLLHEI